jgi:hypothetical protein
VWIRAFNTNNFTAIISGLSSLISIQAIRLFKGLAGEVVGRWPAPSAPRPRRNQHPAPPGRAPSSPAQVGQVTRPGHPAGGPPP